MERLLVLRYDPRTMAKKILAVVVGIVVLLLAVIAMQPGEFTIKRSATINAPADIVYAQVNDFKAWSAWSPWEKMDPNQARTFSEPSGGEGANYHWKGNKDVGEGNMKITSAKPFTQLVIALDFIEPFPANNVTTFDFSDVGGGATTVTWSMSGKNSFPAKAFGLFMNMDKMVGADFEKGLASIKEISEKNAAEAKKAVEAAEAEARAKAAEAANAADAGTATPDAGTP
jgi:uncharacterized protein YndB with AHSA1/START domain